ncbi:hypothetical protein AA309_29545 [Microvirga vignae]|uniref:PPM-type phosphatase domain-containing protein n=1 Tax=Microvirga vignae TaxID=1225564 RepID=A0A0H1R3H9_9HYPH|nr:protein phosphatase 2C domain-containing protein [Microvirga vignae]KLK89780.1 hypothetical protein AA309_29545 [Microvirga vignae]
MRFSYATFSEKGPRAENEDAIGVWHLNDDWMAVAIADGLGGHLGGRRASEIAIEQFGSMLQEPTIPDLAQIAHEIHTIIRGEQDQKLELRGMATTFSAALLISNRMRLVHVGDTRISIQRTAGIKRLTHDHTEAYRLLTTGKLTRYEYDNYPRKHILVSALGVHGNPQIDTDQITLEVGDRIFFSSDGVHNKIPLRELKAISDQVTGPQKLCAEVQRLVEGRKPEDNYSFAAVFVDRN